MPMAARPPPLATSTGPGARSTTAWCRAQRSPRECRARNISPSWRPVALDLGRDLDRLTSLPSISRLRCNQAYRPSPAPSLILHSRSSSIGARSARLRLEIAIGYRQMLVPAELFRPTLRSTTRARRVRCTTASVPDRQSPPGREIRRSHSHRVDLATHDAHGGPPPDRLSELHCSVYWEANHERTTRTAHDKS